MSLTAVSLCVVITVFAMLTTDRQRNAAGESTQTSESEQGTTGAGKDMAEEPFAVYISGSDEYGDIESAGSIGNYNTKDMIGWENGDKVQLESVEKESKYWYVFFANEGNDTGYYFALNAKNYSKEETIEMARKIRFKE